jgi:hypothetical protein
LSHTIKYLGLGLIIGLLGASIVLAVGLFYSTSALARPATKPLAGATYTLIEPSSTPTPRFLPSPTLTPTPTMMLLQSAAPDANLLSTATPDAVQSMIDHGGLIFTGSLSNDQQITLYKASLNYVEPTVHDSIRKAKEINGVGYGDPSNICGPLAIAIMQDAGLLKDITLVPHDFWLLNPLSTGDDNLLKRVFPSDRFLHTRFTNPLNRINWRIFPLQPGDFLFIWHGSGGNFDHMLVVTRVDSNLNAYTVTNYGTPEGFVIAETLLYNPADPNVGIFHVWTEERDAILGSTGFGGFDLWRPYSP